MVTRSAQRNTTGKPNTGFHRHSTCSARLNLGISSPKAAVPCTYTYSECQPPKSSGCVATVSLWIPSLVFIHSLRCKTPGTDPCHTSNGHWCHMNKMRSSAFWASTCLFCVCDLSCLILQQLLQLLIPIRTAQRLCQMPFPDNSVQQAHQESWHKYEFG